jgi:hypothetical protein
LPEEPTRDQGKRKNLSSSKKYSQEEFSFKSDNRLIRVDLKTAGTTPEYVKEELHAEPKNRLSDPMEKINISVSKTDKKLKSSVLKKLKTTNIEMRDDSFELENVKFTQSIDDFSSFTFLNCFNGNNLGNELGESISEAIDLSDYPSLKMEKPRKKSYIEDMSLASKFSPTLKPRKLDKADNSINQQDIVFDGAMQNVQSYYDYTFECMKKIQNIQRLPIEQVTYQRLENLPFEKDIYFLSKLIF